MKKSESIKINKELVWSLTPEILTDMSLSEYKKLRKVIGLREIPWWKRLGRKIGL